MLRVTGHSKVILRFEVTCYLKTWMELTFFRPTFVAVLAESGKIPFEILMRRHLAKVAYNPKGHGETMQSDWLKPFYLFIFYFSRRNSKLKTTRSYIRIHRIKFSTRSVESHGRMIIRSAFAGTCWRRHRTIGDTRSPAGKRMIFQSGLAKDSRDINGEP